MRSCSSAAEAVTLRVLRLEKAVEGAGGHTAASYRIVVRLATRHAETTVILLTLSLSPPIETPSKGRGGSAE